MPHSIRERLAVPALPTVAVGSLLLLSLGLPAAAATLSVGPGKTYTTPCQAFARAADGDIVEIEGGTTYTGDVCGIYPHNLTIRGVNGRPRIDAGGRYSMGKGIWVVVGNGTTIENVEMYGAKVPDRNGAALRVDGMHLTLRNSHLHHNENGILTNNDGVSNIVIEGTEFGFNGYGDGYSHNLYVGKVKSLVFRGNYSHDANVGHNLKSRAGTNLIAYSRFSSSTGQPSYEIDLPNAGSSVIIGNVIHQPAGNQNPGLVTFGVEGASNAGQDLHVVNNTFINDNSSSGTFLFIGGGVSVPVVAQNNLFVGTGTFSTQGSTVDRSNLKVVSYAFVNRANGDLRPMPGTQAVDAGTALAPLPSGTSLTPAMEYRPVASSRARTVAGKIDIGAYESTSAALTAADSPPSASAPVPVPPQASPEAWTVCAREESTCVVPSPRTVRYGADGKYFFRTVQAHVACNNATFGDPIRGTVKTCAFDASLPAVTSWSLCAMENASCAVAGTRQVRYGADGQYVYKTVTGSVRCDNAAFGDPVKGKIKTCEVASR